MSCITTLYNESGQDLYIGVVRPSIGIGGILPPTPLKNGESIQYHLPLPIKVTFSSLNQIVDYGTYTGHKIVNVSVYHNGYYVSINSSVLNIEQCGLYVIGSC